MVLIFEKIRSFKCFAIVYVSLYVYIMSVEFYEPFVAGGIAGMLASSVVHPIDLVKVRLQLFATFSPELPRPSFPSLLVKMIRNEGMYSIYSGLSASLLRQSVYATTRFGLHRTFSNMFKKRNNNQPIPFYQKVISGMASGSIGVILCTPIDVSLVRMQSDSMSSVETRKGYKHVFDALWRIGKEEGVSKLYSGLLPSILRGMAVNVGMMAFYDQTKEIIQRHRGEDINREASQSTQIVSAFIAGFTNTILALPFDIVKSRLQYSAGKYSGIRDVVSVIWKREGVAAFWTGYWAYYLRTAPHNMIILISTAHIVRTYSWLASDNRSSSGSS